MTKDLYTTGQLSGITWLTRQTLYRFTTEFPDYFSSTAKQHQRGRRWTDADLRTVEAIRTMHQGRLGNEKIAEALRAGWRPPVGSHTDQAELSRILHEIYATNELSHKTMAKLIGLVDTYEARLKQLTQRVDKLEARSRRIKLDERLKHLLKG